MRIILLALFLGLLANAASPPPVNPPAHQPPYPDHWWKVELKKDEKIPEWEILPPQAAYGEVILSKRNELGLLSNFAPTPFQFRGKMFASMEGLWQSTKFPEGKKDERFGDSDVSWPYTRAQVERMTAFDAKRAGDVGSKNMKTLGIDWVTFDGQKMIYRQPAKGEFYKVITTAMKAKLCQNPEVKKVLLQTGELILRPDHHQNADDPPAWRYYEIWMEYRKRLREDAKFCER